MKFFYYFPTPARINFNLIFSIVIDSSFNVCLQYFRVLIVQLNWYDIKKFQIKTKIFTLSFSKNTNYLFENFYIEELHQV